VLNEDIVKKLEGNDVPFSLLCPIIPVPKKVTTNKLHNYESMTEELKQLEKENPKDVKLRSFGKSVEGREIWCVEIGHGEKKLFVSCRMHADEVMGTESMLNYISKLAPNQEKEAVRMKKEAKLIVIPMVNVDAANFYVKTKQYTGGLRLPEELLDWWMEHSRRNSVYDLYELIFSRLSYVYANNRTDVFNMITKHKDSVTGLTKYISNLDDWIWIDDAGNFPYIYNSNRDNWQLTHPENRALRDALMAYEPRWYIDLHGSQGEFLPRKLREIREEVHKWELFEQKLPWAGWSVTTTSVQYYAHDPEAAWKGIPLSQRFSDPKYLRFSRLPEMKKSMRGYLYPEATRWEMDESLKIDKIAVTAMEKENGIYMEPINYCHWRGGSAHPLTAHNAAAHIPEFECASIVLENWAGAGSYYGDYGLEKTLPYFESGVNAVLKYIVGLDLPESWENFPVFQGPHDVWTRKEWLQRKAKSDPEFYETFFPDLKKESGL
jgi:hypothetical protein